MNRQRGFTLVSLMVGLVISLVVVLAVYGSASFFEANRRQMVSGNDAFENALGALIAVQRATKQAGMAISLDGRLACQAVNIFRDGAVRADGLMIPPVRIVDGGEDSDSLTVAFADSLLATMPAQSIRPMNPGDTSILTSNAIGLNVGDLVMVGSPGSTDPCTLMQISAIEPSAAPLGSRVRHEGLSTWNPVDRTVEFTTMPTYAPGSLVQRVGGWNWLTYRVVAGQLEERDNTTATTNLIADGIVYFKAAYGTTDGLNQTIQQWALPVDAWANPDIVQLNAVRALQIGIVARNAQRIKPTVAGGACDATTVANITLWPAGPIVDLSRLGADWGCYQYRVLTLAVPLRNMIFGI